MIMLIQYLCQLKQMMMMNRYDFEEERKKNKLILFIFY
jgi:hypothetical protein